MIVSEHKTRELFAYCSRLILLARSHMQVTIRCRRMPAASLAQRGIERMVIQKLRTKLGILRACLPLTLMRAAHLESLEEGVLEAAVGVGGLLAERKWVADQALGSG